MPNFHLEAAIVSRGSGQSAIAKAAYDAREKLIDEQDNTIKDYRKKGGLIKSDIILPEGAPDWMKDRQKLWNAVEQKEDQSKRWETAQLARRYIYAIPNDLSRNEQIDLIQDIAKNVFAKKGMICDYAIHEPDKDGDPRNTHAHLLLTMRNIENGEFKNKNRDWNTKESLNQVREEVCNITNKYLKKYNLPLLDHRTFAEQGIDRKPKERIPITIYNRNRRFNNIKNEIEKELLKVTADIAMEKEAERIKTIQQKPPISTVPRSENQKPTVQIHEPLQPRPVKKIINPEWKTNHIKNKGDIKMNTSSKTIEGMLEAMKKERKELCNITNTTAMTIFKAQIIGEVMGLDKVIKNIEDITKGGYSIYHMSNFAKLDGNLIKEITDNKPIQPLKDFGSEEYNKKYSEGYYLGLKNGKGYIDALFQREIQLDNARKANQQPKQKIKGLKR